MATDKRIRLRTTKTHFLPLSVVDRDNLIEVYGWGSIPRDREESHYDTALFMASLRGFVLSVLR